MGYVKANKQGSGEQFSNAYTNIDRVVGGILPGGRNIQDGYLGKFWDSFIGREGIIGAIGSATGLWESGTDADKRRTAKDANTEYLDSQEERKQQVMPKAINLMNTENLANANQFEGLLGGLNSSGLATNNNKTIERNKMVAGSLARMNAKFDRTIEGANNKMDTIDDNIYLAEQQRRDLT